MAETPYADKTYEYIKPLLPFTSPATLPTIKTLLQSMELEVRLDQLERDNAD